MSFKLYFTPTSCGASSFLAAHIGGLEGKFEPETVNMYDPKRPTASGKDFFAINPKGNVPAIVLPDGALIAENVATLIYVADQAAQRGTGPRLAPERGTTEWYLFLHQLSFLATEMHMGAYGPLFGKTLSDAEKEKHRKVVVPKAFKSLELLIGGKPFLGPQLSVADLYAYIILNWSIVYPSYIGEVPLEQNPAVKAYYERIKALPAVVAAHAAIAALEKKEQEAAAAKK